MLQFAALFNIIFKMQKSGFTLIELILVIVVLGILVAVTLPKFFNAKATAYDKTENMIYGSLAAAAHIYVASLAASGNDVATIAAIYPFSLLTSPPPNYLTTGAWVYDTQDNVNWRVYDASGLGAYFIQCPHYTGGYQGDTWNGHPPNHGRFYIFQYSNTATWGHKAGDIWSHHGPGLYGH